MTDFTIRDILAACGGRFSGDPAILDRPVTAIVTDSRQVMPGCLFAAIPGEKVDGHDFIPAAMAAGALCCLCSREAGEGVNQIRVAETARALQPIAAAYRLRFSIPVIGVTGSVGKTTTKEMVASVLSQRFRTLKTQGNFNNELGVPLTLFRLSPEHEAAVVEMGISHFGEMERLAAMVRPDVALIANVGFAHLEFLEDRAGVLRAKTAILSASVPEAVLVVNGDDELLRDYPYPGEKITFGLEPDCDVRAENLQLMGMEGTRCELCIGARRIPAEIPAFGVHMVHAALAAAAVGTRLGLTDDEICAGIRAYQPVGRRSNAVDTGFCVLIDDCYNANPTSLSSALSSLALLPGRKVCILGDMKELGPASPELHREMGALCARLGVELLITCGEQAAFFGQGAKQEEHAPAVWHFPDREEVIAVLPHLLQKGDAVLVKASNSMGFDKISEAVKAL